ncbi:PHD finger family protein [Actinidia rufa]|uniref:PHD finger family protein n=1 Tax=Actinidia rufa TaxID=165716 RepID=A0A7J0FK58_9ERIC|nr:PHD finger family protein [Actinidia rufa]
MAKTKPGKKDLDSYNIKGTNKVVRPGDLSGSGGTTVQRSRLEGGGSFMEPRSCSCRTILICRALTPLKGSALFTLSKITPSLRMLGTEDYFCRFEYKAATGGFTPDRVAVYCKCEMPYNPDDLMVQCEGCKDWFHPSCMGMTIEEAKKLDQFMCSDCSSDDDAKRSLNSFPVSPSVEAKVSELLVPV